jgi:hypothetical protein
MGYGDLIKALEEFKGWPDLAQDRGPGRRSPSSRSSLTADERIALAAGARAAARAKACWRWPTPITARPSVDDRLRVIREAWRARAR